ncbi:MAG: cyclic nucleotide-binding domain-containing protein [Cyanobacteria bacterium J06636_28]
MGETIFSEGDPGDSAYIIESGRVEVAVSVNGQPFPLRILSSTLSFSSDGDSA